MLAKTFYSSAISIMILMLIVLISLPTPADQTTAKQANKIVKSLLIKNASIFNGDEVLLSQAKTSKLEMALSNRLLAT